MGNSPQSPFSKGEVRIGFMKIINITVVTILIFLSGCSVIQMKPTGRAASDQMICALAIQDAVESIKIANLVKGKTVRINIGGLANDAEYIAEIVKAYVIRNGAKIADSNSASDLDLTMLFQTAGSDNVEKMWSIPIPMPSIQKGITVTRIDLYKNEIQVSRCRLWAYACNKEGKIIYRHNPVYAAHYISSREFLGLSLGKSTDIPELKRQKGIYNLDQTKAKATYKEINPP